MSRTRTLRIVTHRKWMVDEFTRALRPDEWIVKQHFGMTSLPDDDSVVWMPQIFAARATRQNTSINLTSPGATYLPTMNEALLRRSIKLRTAGMARHNPVAGHWALAETSNAQFAPRWRTTDELLDDLRDAQIPDASALHYTDTKLDLILEYRCVIVSGTILTGGFFTDHVGHDLGEPGFMEPDSDSESQATQFAKLAADFGGAPDDLSIAPPPPRVYTMDVGFDRVLQTWVVAGVHAIWSASWYACHLPSFAAALAYDQARDPGIWRWTPDALLIDRIVRLPALVPEHSG